MANDEVLGPRKTMFVLVIVVGCFAVLWPRILSPLILGHTQDQLKPNKFDREAGCCEVIFQTEVAALELMNEVCNSALGVTKLSPQSAMDCRKAVNETCGVDIAAFLKREENVGKSTKKLVVALTNSNSSCLRENFGVPIYSLSTHSPINSWTLQDSVKQERPLRGMAPHPALQERGRAIPPGVPPAGRQQMPPHVRVRSPLSVYLEVEPPPIPGMRPPLGSAGGPVAAPKSSMGFVMPIYTICIIVFFVYTLSKILFKRTGTPYDPVIPDPQFRRRVFRDDSRTTPDKLVVTAISGLVAEVQQQMEASQQRQESPDNHARPYTNGTILLNTGPVQIVTSEYQEPKDQSPVLAKTKENLSERKESSPETKESSDLNDPILDIHSTQTKELTPILEENSQTKETSETKEIKNQNDTHPIPKDIEDVDVSSLEQTQSSIEQEESSITHKEHTPEPILPQPKQKDSSPELKQESEERAQVPSASSIEHKEHFSEIKRSVTERDHISSDQILDSEEKEISLDACVQEDLHSELSLKQKESSLEQEELLNEHDDVFPDSLSSEHHTSPNLKEASIEQASPLLHKQISPESSLKEKELLPEPKELSVEPSVELKDTDSDEELPTDPNEPLPIQKESPPVQESSLQPKATLFEEETCPEPKETFIEKEIIPDPNASSTIQKESSPVQQALFHPKESSEEQIVSVERETLEPDEGMQSRSKPEHESSIMQDEVASQRNDTADQKLVKEHTPEPTEEELIDISGIEDKIKTTEITSKTVTKINDKVDDLSKSIKSKEIDEEILKKPGNIHVKRDTIDKTEEFLKEERDTATKDGPTTPELLAEALKEDSPEGNDNESSSVKVVGMEVTAHPADGSAWPGPPPRAAHPPATNTHKAEDVKSIFLETEIPQQSRVLVADFEDRADAQRAAKNAPLVVSGKMTLSLIQDAPRDTPERDPESTMDEFSTASAMTQPAEKDDDLSDEELEEEIDVEEIEEELEELEEEEEEEEEIELGANKTGSKSDKK